MSKKKTKNFKIEDQELTPITVGHFESRKKSSLGIFIILSLFILLVIFLPEITDYVNAYLDSKNNVVNPGYRPNDPIVIPPGDGEEEKTYYTYNENLVISDDNITLSHIVIDNSLKTISFDVTNKSSSSLLDLNYYLELYDEDHTLLERLKLATKENVRAGEEQTLVKNISDDSLNLQDLSLSKLDTKEYPVVSLNANSDGEATLVCENKHETVTYKFINNELKELASDIKYSSLEEGYADIYYNYRTLLNQYNVTNGVSATFFESTDGFNGVINVNLANASRMYIINADTFSLNTEPKIVKFEMESQGFDCK